MNPKLLAIYFPQFHNLPENDEWWGKDFTDWELVKKAEPLFPGHYQPRIPLHSDYYNPCEADVLRRQVALAQQYHIGGFMFYHYWFDGKLLMEKPLLTMLQNKDIDFPFCLSWANASWTRQWKGNNEFLLQQKHTPDPALWRQHFDFLLPFWLDKRAIRIDDKPVFAIYAPNLVNDTQRMFEHWNQWAKEAGLKGIYFIAMQNYDFTNAGFLRYYDALMRFQPREANTSEANPHHQKLMSVSALRVLPEYLQNKLAGIRLRFKSVSHIDSRQIWDFVLDRAYQQQKYTEYHLPIIESAFFDWDNTARYGKRATIYDPLTLDEKRHYLSELYRKACDHQSPFIVFNAWNEWSESAYLEPDEQFKDAHLQIIKDIFPA